MLVLRPVGEYFYTKLTNSKPCLHVLLIHNKLNSTKINNANYKTWFQYMNNVNKQCY